MQEYIIADDSTLLASFTKTDIDVALKINNELASVIRWLDTNKMCINAYKTKCMHFSYKRNIDIPLLKVKNGVVCNVEYIRFLGMHLGKHLTFKNPLN